MLSENDTSDRTKYRHQLTKRQETVRNSLNWSLKIFSFRLMRTKKIIRVRLVMKRVVIQAAKSSLMRTEKSKSIESQSQLSQNQNPS